MQNTHAYIQLGTIGQFHGNRITDFCQLFTLRLLKGKLTFSYAKKISSKQKYVRLPTYTVIGFTVWLIYPSYIVSQSSVTGLRAKFTNCYFLTSLTQFCSVEKCIEKLTLSSICHTCGVLKPATVKL